jgi:cell division protein FtsB
MVEAWKCGPIQHFNNLAIQQYKMAKNRKNQAAAIRFGPALKASFLCLLIGGSAVGYVWQKSQVYQLGKQIRETESRLAQLERNNQMLADQLADLRSPVKLDQRARNLGLVPAQPAQVVRLSESPVMPSDKNNFARQLAARPAGLTAQ